MLKKTKDEEFKEKSDLKVEKKSNNKFWAILAIVNFVIALAVVGYIIGTTVIKKKSDVEEVTPKVIARYNDSNTERFTNVLSAMFGVNEEETNVNYTVAEKAVRNASGDMIEAWVHAFEEAEIPEATFYSIVEYLEGYYNDYFSNGQKMKSYFNHDELNARLKEAGLKTVEEYEASGGKIVETNNLSTSPDKVFDINKLTNDEKISYLTNLYAKLTNDYNYFSSKFQQINLWDSISTDTMASIIKNELDDTTSNTSTDHIVNLMQQKNLIDNDELDQLKSDYNSNYYDPNKVFNYYYIKNEDASVINNEAVLDTLKGNIVNVIRRFNTSYSGEGSIEEVCNKFLSDDNINYLLEDIGKYYNSDDASYQNSGDYNNSSIVRKVVVAVDCLNKNFKSYKSYMKVVFLKTGGNLQNYSSLTFYDVVILANKTIVNNYSNNNNYAIKLENVFSSYSNLSTETHVEILKFFELFTGGKLSLSNYYNDLTESNFDQASKLIYESSYINSKYKPQSYNPGNPQATILQMITLINDDSIGKYTATTDTSRTNVYVDFFIDELTNIVSDVQKGTPNAGEDPTIMGFLFGFSEKLKELGITTEEQGRIIYYGIHEMLIVISDNQRYYQALLRSSLDKYTTVTNETKIAYLESILGALITIDIDDIIKEWENQGVEKIGDMFKKLIDSTSTLLGLARSVTNDSLAQLKEQIVKVVDGSKDGSGFISAGKLVQNLFLSYKYELDSEIEVIYDENNNKIGSRFITIDDDIYSTFDCLETIIMATVTLTTKKDNESVVNIHITEPLLDAVDLFINTTSNTAYNILTTFEDSDLCNQLAYDLYMRETNKQNNRTFELNDGMGMVQAINYIIESSNIDLNNSATEKLTGIYGINISIDDMLNTLYNYFFDLMEIQNNSNDVTLDILGQSISIGSTISNYRNYSYPLLIGKIIAKRSGMDFYTYDIGHDGGRFYKSFVLNNNNVSLDDMKTVLKADVSNEEVILNAIKSIIIRYYYYIDSPTITKVQNDLNKNDGNTDLSLLEYTAFEDVDEIVIPSKATDTEVIIALKFLASALMGEGDTLQITNQHSVKFDREGFTTKTIGEFLKIFVSVITSNLSNYDSYRQVLIGLVNSIQNSSNNNTNQSNNTNQNSSNNEQLSEIYNKLSNIVSAIPDLNAMVQVPLTIKEVENEEGITKYIACEWVDGNILKLAVDSDNVYILTSDDIYLDFDQFDFYLKAESAKVESDIVKVTKGSIEYKRKNSNEELQRLSYEYLSENVVIASLFNQVKINENIYNVLKNNINSKDYLSIEGAYDVISAYYESVTGKIPLVFAEFKENGDIIEANLYDYIEQMLRELNIRQIIDNFNKIARLSYYNKLTANLKRGDNSAEYTLNSTLLSEMPDSLTRNDLNRYIGTLNVENFINSYGSIDKVTITRESSVKEFDYSKIINKSTETASDIEKTVKELLTAFVNILNDNTSDDSKKISEEDLNNLDFYTILSKINEFDSIDVSIKTETYSFSRDNSNKFVLGESNINKNVISIGQLNKTFITTDYSDTTINRLNTSMNNNLNNKLTIDEVAQALSITTGVSDTTKEKIKKVLLSGKLSQMSIASLYIDRLVDIHNSENSLNGYIDNYLTLINSYAPTIYTLVSQNLSQISISNKFVLTYYISLNSNEDGYNFGYYHLYKGLFGLVDSGTSVLKYSFITEFIKAVASLPIYTISNSGAKIGFGSDGYLDSLSSSGANFYIYKTYDSNVEKSYILDFELAWMLDMGVNNFFVSEDEFIKVLHGEYLNNPSDDYIVNRSKTLLRSAWKQNYTLSQVFETKVKFEKIMRANYNLNLATFRDIYENNIFNVKDSGYYSDLYDFIAKALKEGIRIETEGVVMYYNVSERYIYNDLYMRINDGYKSVVGMILYLTEIPQSVLSGLLEQISKNVLKVLTPVFANIYVNIAGSASSNSN